jgi:hypothetical protein
MSHSDYTSFLQALNFKPSDQVCVSFSAGPGDWNNAFRPFEYLGEPDTFSRLADKSEEGKNIYISMAPFRVGTENRKKECVSEIRHVFVEKDENAGDMLKQIQADDVQRDHSEQPTKIEGLVSKAHSAVIAPTSIDRCVIKRSTLRGGSVRHPFTGKNSECLP